jgi:hypothetical protein
MTPYWNGNSHRQLLFICLFLMNAFAMTMSAQTPDPAHCSDNNDNVRACTTAFVAEVKKFKTLSSDLISILKRRFPESDLTTIKNQYNAARDEFSIAVNLIRSSQPNFPLIKNQLTTATQKYTTFSNSANTKLTGGPAAAFGIPFGLFNWFVDLVPGLPPAVRKLIKDLLHDLEINQAKLKPWTDIKAATA